MTIKRIFKLTVLLLGIASCNNGLKEVSTPELNILITNNSGVETTTFKVGDTINYIFSGGNPDNIYFYSGEIGYRYKYKGSDSDTSSAVFLKFATAKNITGNGSLALLVSNDYTGYTGNRNIDSLNVSKATWTDISDRAQWAMSSSTTQSGSISLKDYALQGKPISLAYRYDATGGVTQAKYTISQISLRHYARDTSYLLDTTLYALPTILPSWTYSEGWARIWTINPNAPFVVTNTSTPTNADYSGSATTSFVHSGDTTSALLAAQSWLVSGPIDLSRVIPEVNLPIKNSTENIDLIHKGFYASQNANFTYQYTRAGTYVVVFKLYNGSIDRSEYTLKKFTITVQ